MVTQPAEKIVFAVSFEAMFIRGLGGDLPPALQQALAGLKVDLKNLQVGYPLAVWKDALSAARRVLYPDLADAQAYEQLGRLFIRSYFETFIGRALKPLLRVIGVARSLERMRQNFRSGNNFSDSTFEKTGERSCHLHFNNDLGHPSFVLGIIHEGIILAVDPSFQMTALESNAPEANYRCSWG